MRRVIVPTLLLVLLPVIGCSTSVAGSASSSTSTSSNSDGGGGGGTMRNTSCVNGDCSIALSGEQTFQLDVGRLERQVRVGPIGDGEVTLSVGYEQVVAAEGATVVLDGVSFTVEDVSDGAVEMSAQAA